MADNNEESIRRETEAREAATKSTVNTTKQLADAFEDLIDRNKSAKEKLDKLNRELDTGKKRLVDIGPALEDLQESIEKTVDAGERARLQAQLEQKQDQASREQSRRMRIDGAAELVKGLASMGVNITKSVLSSYQSNASAFSTAGDVASTALDSANQTVKGLSSVASTAAGGLMFLGPKGIAAGIALQSLAVGAQAVFEKFTELSKFAINVAVKELEKTTQAFAQVSAAGAMFSNGLSELRATAGQAGLVQEEFAKVVANNNQILSQFGGSVGNGARVLANVTKALGTGPGSLRDGLLSLGYSVEDIADGTANYMEIQAAQGRAERRDYANLAKETDSYLTNLRMISAFTGEDAKKAQARAREAATQSAVSAKLRTMDSKAQERFRSGISNLPEGLQKAVQQMFVSGAITDTDLATAVYNNAEAFEVLRRTMGYVNDASLDGTEVSRRIQADQKQFGEAIVRNADRMSASTGVANVLTGTLGGLDAANRSLQEFGLKKQIPGEKSAAQATEDSKTTLDELTKSYREAIDVNQNLKVSIQTELTGAITGFAELTKNIITELRDTLGYFTKDRSKSAGVDYGEVAVNMEGTPLITPEAPVAPATPKKATPTPGAKTNPNLPVSGQPGSGSVVTATNLKLKQGAQSYGSSKDTLYQMAEQVHAMLGGDYKYFSGLKDRGIDAGGAHPQGRAFDLVLNDLKQYPDVVSKLKSMPGFSRVLDESIAPANPAQRDKWGPHIHAEVAAAQGAIISASTGGTNVTVGEGGASEVIAPLKNGRLPGMDEMIERLDQMISVMKDHRDTSEKIFNATA
jgi:hypothetical protein